MLPGSWLCSAAGLLWSGTPKSSTLRRPSFRSASTCRQVASRSVRWMPGRLAMSLLPGWEVTK